MAGRAGRHGDYSYYHPSYVMRQVGAANDAIKGETLADLQAIAARFGQV